MAAKKKTNYIGEELEWLEARCLELREWVQSKLSGGISDRIEVFEGGRTPIIKVISSEEQQITVLRATLKELPSMLMEIQRLRKFAEDEETDGPQIRGDYDMPGFMEEDEDEPDDNFDDEDEVKPAPKQKSKSKKQEKEAPKKSSPKTLLPGPAAKSSASFAEEEDELHDLDDGDFEDP